MTEEEWREWEAGSNARSRRLYERAKKLEAEYEAREREREAREREAEERRARRRRFLFFR
jgi:hypothetical protein